MKQNIIKKQIFIKLLVVSYCCLAIAACVDLVSESDEVAKCQEAFDKRQYSDALDVCEEDTELAAARMGLAGFDIPNLLDNTAEDASLVTNTTITTVLGEEDVSTLTILNTLGLNVSSIADATQRATSINDALTNLDAAIALYEPIAGSAMDIDDIILETFANAMALSLFYNAALDIGTARAKSLSSLNDCFDAVPNTGDSDTDTLIEAEIVANDGHMWTGEQNAAFCTLLLPDLDLNQTYDAAGKITVLTGTSNAAICTFINDLTARTTALSGTVIKLSEKGLSGLEGFDTSEFVNEVDTAASSISDSFNSLLTTIGLPCT